MKQTESVKRSFFETVVKEYAGHHVDYKIKRDGVIITRNGAYIPKDHNDLIDYCSKKFGMNASAILASIGYSATIDGCILSYDGNDTITITSNSTYQDITYFAIRHDRFSTPDYVQEGGFYVIYDSIGDVNIPYKPGDFPEEDAKLDRISAAFTGKYNSESNLYRRVPRLNKETGRIYGPISVILSHAEAMKISDKLISMIDKEERLDRDKISRIVIDQLSKRYTDLFNDEAEDYGIIYDKLNLSRSKRYKDMTFDKETMLPVIPAPRDTYRLFVLFRMTADGGMFVTSECTEIKDIDMYTSKSSTHYSLRVGVYVDLSIGYDMTDTIFYTVSKIGDENIFDETKKEEEPIMKTNHEHISNLYYMPKYNGKADETGSVHGPIAIKLSESDADNIAEAAVKAFGVDDNDHIFHNAIVTLLANDYINIDGTDNYDQYAKYERMQVACDVEDGKITAFHDINHGRLVPINRTIYHILVGIKMSDDSDYADVFAICPEFGTVEQIPDIKEGENAIAIYADVFVHHDDDFNVYAFVTRTYDTNIYQERMRYAPYAVPRKFKGNEATEVAEYKTPEIDRLIITEQDPEDGPTPCDILNGRIGAAICTIVFNDYENNNVTVGVFTLINEFLQNIDVWARLSACESSTIEIVVDDIGEETQCRMKAYARDMTIETLPERGLYVFEIVKTDEAIIMNTFFDGEFKCTDYIAYIF